MKETAENERIYITEFGKKMTELDRKRKNWRLTTNLFKRKNLMSGDSEPGHRFRYKNIKVKVITMAASKDKYPQREYCNVRNWVTDN